MRYSSYDGTVVIILIIIYLALLVLYVFGCIASYVAITHSVKKRVVRGEHYSAGSVFAWTLGWGAATAYSFGIATIIYYFVQRAQIRAVDSRHRELMGYLRAMNMQQVPLQYAPQQPMPSQQAAPQYMPQQQAVPQYAPQQQIPTQPTPPQTPPQQ